MCQCAPRRVSHFSIALSHAPRWPLSWGYNSTMQCLLNPVSKQLCEWGLEGGQTLPYCSNSEVELMFALLCFATPYNPHWLWMGIKHQVAQSAQSVTTKSHTERPNHLAPVNAFSQYRLNKSSDRDCQCIIFSRGWKGWVTTQWRNRTIYTNDTHT